MKICESCGKEIDTKSKKPFAINSAKQFVLFACGCNHITKVKLSDWQKECNPEIIEKDKIN